MDQHKRKKFNLFYGKPFGTSAYDDVSIEMYRKKTTSKTTLIINLFYLPKLMITFWTEKCYFHGVTAIPGNRWPGTGNTPGVTPTPSLLPAIAVTNFHVVFDVVFCLYISMETSSYAYVPNGFPYFSNG